jgi:hypothetical protein
MIANRMVPDSCWATPAALLSHYGYTICTNGSSQAATREDPRGRDQRALRSASPGADMAYDTELADRIRFLIGTGPGVTEKMFGGLAFLVGDNMAISASGQGGALVRADLADTDALIAGGNATLAVMRGANGGRRRAMLADLDRRLMQLDGLSGYGQRYDATVQGTAARQDFGLVGRAPGPAYPPAWRCSGCRGVRVRRGRGRAGPRPGRWRPPRAERSAARRWRPGHRGVRARPRQPASSPRESRNATSKAKNSPCTARPSFMIPPVPTCPARRPDIVTVCRLPAIARPQCPAQGGRFQPPTGQSASISVSSPTFRQPHSYPIRVQTDVLAAIHAGCRFAGAGLENHEVCSLSLRVRHM